jgi:hypothetical protein
VVFAKACERETSGELLSLREEPQLAEGQEPGLRQDVSVLLGNFRRCASAIWFGVIAQGVLMLLRP